MSGIAGILQWNGAPVPQETVDRMAGLMRHRGPDGLRVDRRGPVAFAHALRAQRTVELRQVQPVWLDDSGLAIVADATIFNRRELQHRLGPVDWFRSDPSDAELILAAFQRWGEDVVDLLDGEYAFVIADSTLRRVFAARDVFGVRPLFFHCDRDGLVFASEPKQIIAAGVSPAINDEIVGEFLFDFFQSHDQTFFRHVNRLKPGHRLIATPDSCTQSLYWKIDPDRETHLPARQDYLDRFRELLREAVAKRLETDYPAVAHLSGGFDSSSVVALAAAIFREGRRDTSRLHTISNVFPGTDCDETVYSQAVADSTEFPHHRLEPMAEPVWQGAEEDAWQTDGPWGADLQRGVFSAHARVLRETGARLVLTGIGGDEIADEPYYLNDLVTRRRYFRAVRDMWRMRDYAYRPHLMIKWVLRASVPKPLKRLYRRFRPAIDRFPDWAAPSFVEYFRACPSPQPRQDCFPSLTQQVSYNCLTGAWLCWCLEYQEQKWSYLGADVRHPFLDRALAEFCLSIPFGERIPDAKFKYLLREGMGPSLPPVLANRKRKTVFYAYERTVLARDKELIAADVSGPGRDRLQPYILPEFLSLKVLEKFPDNQLWKIASLHLWLNLHARYNSLQAGRERVHAFGRSGYTQTGKL